MAYLDAPYVAGIIDGEGSILIGRTNRTRPEYSAMVTVHNTTLELIDSLVETFGGSVSTRQPRGLSTKVGYQWSLKARSEVKECLEIVLPWLIMKKAKAELVLEFLVESTDYGVSRRPVPPDEQCMREGYYHAVMEAV